MKVTQVVLRLLWKGAVSKRCYVQVGQEGQVTHGSHVHAEVMSGSDRGLHAPCAAAAAYLHEG